MGSVDRARDVLRRHIADTAGTVHRRLPTVAALARSAQVANATMAAVIREAAKKGLVEVRDRHGIYLPSPAGEAPAAGPPVRMTRWRRVAAALEVSISTGVAEEEKSLAELCRDYACNYRTMRKALAYLDRCEMWGGDKPRRRADRSGGIVKTIILCGLGYDYGVTNLIPARTRETVRTFNSLCAEAGIRIHLVPFLGADVPGGGAVSVATACRKLRKTSAFLGTAVWTVGMNPPDVSALLAALAPLQTPVAFFDETGNAGSIRGSLDTRLARVFDFYHTRMPGRVAGRHLLARGHRRICFIPDTPWSPWCCNRLAGLRGVMEGAGGTVEIAEPKPSVEERPWTESRAGASTIRGMQRIVSRATAEGNRDCGMVRNAVIGLGTAIDLLCAANDQHEAVTLRCAHALGTNATAWVCANDAVAVECLEFLQSRGIHVPRDISVLGFDNSLESFRADLSSYAEDGRMLLTLLLNFLIQPIHFNRRFPQAAMGAAGGIIERGSVKALRAVKPASSSNRCRL